jgi:hypothetical protein
MEIPMTKLQKFMAAPENRIKYALEWHTEYIGDQEMQDVALTKALFWIAECEDLTVHY